MSATPASSALETARQPLSRRLGRWFARILRALFALAVLWIAGRAAFHEMQTSALQARIFGALASQLSYSLEAGPSARVTFPLHGPFDEMRGYTRIPEFRERLEARGFRVTRQALVSPRFTQLQGWGIPPPYAEPPRAGLAVRAHGATVHEVTRGRSSFESFEQIPPLVVSTLLTLENRELLNPPYPTTNPAVEWHRLSKASVLYAAARVGLPVSREGGSTLATQLVKFRHSPSGRTDSPFEKLRQIAGASLKAYRHGADTTEARHEIVLEYLNSMPLAAAPGYGEVHGLGEGLQAWFGLSLDDVSAALRPDALVEEAAPAYKHVLALLAALPAPTQYLARDRDALERRVASQLRLLQRAGLIDQELARKAAAAPLRAERSRASRPIQEIADLRASLAARTRLLALLDVRNFYELDRLDLEADVSFDAALQADAVEMLRNLGKREFVTAHGLYGERLLQGADPAKVLYSLVLYERTPDGNFLRVQADNVQQAFDLSRGSKIELGSTAKLRTLAHYLEVVAELHDELGGLDAETLRRRASTARDPLTSWAAESSAKRPDTDLRSLLEAALDRRYSASPASFFTGSGLHSFTNFDRLDNGRIRSVREAFWNSTNLVFIRLMRDLVSFHRARLPYDAEAVLSDVKNPTRLELLEEIAARESRMFLARAYKKYRDLPAGEIASRLLGRRAKSPRHLSMLFYAWHRGGTEAELAAWLQERAGDTAAAEASRYARAYGKPHLNLSDFGYLLSLHPLDVWVAGELTRDPGSSWDEVLEGSAEERRLSSAWLFRTRNRHAQDRRLRSAIERDAFVRMAPSWRRLGFPFDRLVPSYATAIGSSGDRPVALAELIGIILNDGERRPPIMIERLHFARGTPYETVFEPVNEGGERVMRSEVAVALREALAGVVEHGTARRIAGGVVSTDGKRMRVGGKTGTGDNQYRAPGGGRVVNRTATFAFYMGERYYGVLTAFVPGDKATRYAYTSSLPVAIVKLFAPKLAERAGDSPRAGEIIVQAEPDESRDAPPAG